MAATEKPKQSGRRVVPRLRLDCEARIISRHGTWPAHLHNLSTTGAHVSRATNEEPSWCVLKWLNYEAMGDTVWVRGKFMGIKFDTPIPEEWVLGTRQQAPDVPEYSKLPLRRHLRAV